MIHKPWALPSFFFAGGGGLNLTNPRGIGLPVFLSEKIEREGEGRGKWVRGRTKT